MSLSSTQKGDLYIYLHAVLWAAFPVVSILTFSTISPILSAGISALMAAVFFAVLITVNRGWIQLGKNAPWKDILLTSLFLGIVFYSLLFTGLRHTTAGNASIVELMEVFFSFLILGYFIKHEPIIPTQVLGAAFMVTGAIFILLPRASVWQPGDLIIICATAFAPIGNFFAQRARTKVSTNTIMFLRSVISGIFLITLGLILDPAPTVPMIKLALPFLLMNGFLLLGPSKILWVEGIHRIPISRAISLSCIGPLFTLVFAYLALDEQITVFQVAGFIPMVLGIYFVTRSASDKEIFVEAEGT